MSVALKGAKAPGFGRTGAKHHQARSYEVEFLDGRIIRFTGLTQFCRTNTSYTPAGISELAHGKAKRHRDMIRADLISPSSIIELETPFVRLQ